MQYQKYILSSRSFSSLSRVHGERRIVPFCHKHVYSVISDVSAYRKFVPWCVNSTIVRGPEFSNLRNNITVVKMVVNLEIRFLTYRENYTSYVTMIPNRFIRARSSENGIFKYMVANWKFRPGKMQNYCDVDFYLKVLYKDPVYSKISSYVFDTVLKYILEAFEARCSLP
jgi:coenzyme Q-binding protein COQ10